MSPTAKQIAHAQAVAHAHLVMQLNENPEWVPIYRAMLLRERAAVLTDTKPNDLREELEHIYANGFKAINEWDAHEIADDCMGMFPCGDYDNPESTIEADFAEFVETWIEVDEEE